MGPKGRSAREQLKFLYTVEDTLVVLTQRFLQPILMNFQSSSVRQWSTRYIEHLPSYSGRLRGWREGNIMQKKIKGSWMRRLFVRHLIVEARWSRRSLRRCRTQSHIALNIRATLGPVIPRKGGRGTAILAEDWRQPMPSHNQDRSNWLQSLWNTLTLTPIRRVISLDCKCPNARVLTWHQRWHCMETSASFT